MKVKIFIISVTLFGYITTNALAQDFQVSTHSAVGFAPHIAADSIGNFVIVWDDYRNVEIPYGGKGSDGDIYGQMYDKTGIPIGGNFRISDDSSDTDISFAGQIFPRIAMNKKGAFVVTWVDTRPKATPDDPSPTEFNIYVQRYDFNGNLTGSNFLVNDVPTGGQLNPDIIIRDDGSFVIIWINTHDGIGGADRVFRVNLQAFDSNGTRLGENQKLNLYANQPRIALFKNGNFIIAAKNKAQIFSFPSNVISSPFSISEGYTKEIKISKKNLIYIVHGEDRIVMEQFLDSDIYLQVYDTLGNSVINKFKINDDLTDYWQLYPQIALEDDQIFVAWEDYRNGYQIGDGKCTDIYGQRFELSLTRIGQNFKVAHEKNESQQIRPTATLLNDTIYVAWFDDRLMEFYTNVYPPISKTNVWATIQDFNNPVEGNQIFCTPPTPEPPSSFNFYQSFPNPANNYIIFIYDLPDDGNINLSLFNVLGKEVKVIVNAFHSAGKYSRLFITNNLPSGVYFGRLIAETTSGSTFSSIIKIIIAK